MPHEEFTQLLARSRSGNTAATAELMQQVHEALRGLARQYMARERPEHTLQATALVNEAYLRLVGDQNADWNNRGHFYGAAAQAMRRILIEHARRNRRSRQLQTAQPPDDVIAIAGDDSFADGTDLIALDEALDALNERDPRAVQVIMLRFFTGLTVDQTAAALGVTDRTVRREWSTARLWLLDYMARREATRE